MSYVTVCSAIARHGCITSIFDDVEIVELAKAEGKLPLLRLWASEASDLDMSTLKALAVMAASKGYHGATLAGAAAHVSEDVLGKAKEVFGECELSLSSAAASRYLFGPLPPEAVAGVSPAAASWLPLPLSWNMQDRV
jgi:hypothetical protein